MAFPAAVTAIPGFLLIRELGLLNTFAALVLPTVANGLSIFVLKGFFDALPRELYEAATIDGASEWQIFRHITLPMTTPILAVNALNAFIAAYNSWEWALPPWSPLPASSSSPSPPPSSSSSASASSSAASSSPP